MPDKQTFRERAEALATRATFAALVIAPIGSREFELLYLHGPDPEFFRKTCREFSARGWQPVLLLTWTSKGLAMAHADELLDWPAPLLPDFLQTVCSEFVATVKAMQPADRAKSN